MSNQAASEAYKTPGVIPAAPWRIKALSVLPDYRLEVRFQDGTNGIADFSSILSSKDCGIFQPLLEKAYFGQAHLEMGAVIWPNGADIDPAWMYEQITARKLWSVPL